MWMVDRCANVASRVLEDEDARGVGALVVGRTSLDPQVDDRGEMIDSECDETSGVVIGIENDFAPFVRKRRPAVREPPCGVRGRRFESPDTERAGCTRKVGAPLTRANDMNERTSRRIDPRVGRRRFGAVRHSALLKVPCALVSDSPSRPSFVHVGDDSLSVVLDLRHGIPAIVFWGRPLGEPSSADLDALASSLERPIEHGGLDIVAPLTLISLHSSGSQARPGLEGHRPGGRHWAPVLELRDVELTKSSVSATSRDEIAELEVRTTLSVHRGLFTVSATLSNTGSTRYLLSSFAVTLPLDDAARNIVSLAGRWARESHLETMPFVANHVFETRSGRSSHERQPSLWFASDGVSHGGGDVWATHLVYSGNHSLVAQHLPDGRRCVQLGELLHPGEVCLEPGESYSTPDVIAAFSSYGLSGTAAILHKHLRSARPVSTPRKVMLNTWESVYFNHDSTVLFDLARRAARVGVERFVLDDGWFGSRRNDRSGLGDWVVSPEVYPQGLTPLIEHVESLGMDFGIWVEPECVNEDSDVFRRNPQWALADCGREPVRARNQLVLNLAIPEAFDHVLGQLDALLTENRIAYVKWDMNRPHVAGSGADGSAGSRAQTLAVYRLIDELRTRHPHVEFESCASGGGRVDLGMVRRVDRVWASDTIDALERQEILRGLSLTLPLEFIGSHIGSRVAHTTGRRHTLAFRGLTALFGHLGIEWNLLEATEKDLETLAEIVSLYKNSRALLHSGTFTYCDLDQPLMDPSALAYGVIAHDRSEALFSYVQLRSERHQTPNLVRIAGLDRDARYRVEVVDVAGGVHGMARRQPEWVTSSVTLRGIDLENVGVQPPAIVPESAVLFRLTRQ